MKRLYVPAVVLATLCLVWMATFVRDMHRLAHWHGWL